MQAKNGPVKIGISADPWKRRDQVSTGSASPVFLIFYSTVSGHCSRRYSSPAQALEEGCHAELEHLRLSGEWFNVSVEKAHETIIEVAKECSFVLGHPHLASNRARFNAKDA
jgi:hypothetical protein